MLRVVTATDAKATILALLDEVAAGHERIVVTVPIRSWLGRLAAEVR